MASLAQSKGATSSGTSVNLSLDSAVNENEVVVVVLVGYSAGPTTTATVTSPSGYTTVKQQTTSETTGMYVGCMWKRAGASESNAITATLTDSVTANYLWVGVYTDMPTAGDLYDAVSGGTTQDDNSLVETISTGTTGTLTQADNICFACFGVGTVSSGDAYDNGFALAGKQGDCRVATKIVAATTAVECTHTYTASPTAWWATGMMVVMKSAAPVAAPVNTVPKSGIQVTSATTTQIAMKGGATLSTIDAGGLTTARLWCTSGDITVTLSGSCTITAGANGSSDLTIGNGANTLEFNTVLATAVYQGDADFHGKDTINFVATGTGGSDTDTYYVLNDPRTLTVTFSTTYAQGVDAVENLKANLDVGNLTGQITMVTTDDAANSDTDTIDLVAANTVANVHAIRKRRKRRKIRASEPR